MIRKTYCSECGGEVSPFLGGYCSPCSLKIPELNWTNSTKIKPNFMKTKNKIPKEYQLENLSIWAADKINYLHGDIPKYVLKGYEKGITSVAELDEEQKDILIGVLLKVIKEKQEKLDQIYFIAE